MNIREDFDRFGIQSIHIKSNPCDYGVSWIPVCDTELTLEASEAIDIGIRELFDDNSFTEGEYDFMCGVLTLEGDTVVFEGAQSRQVTFTKLFRTPVLA
jgi:hypothetical protein